MTVTAAATLLPRFPSSPVPEIASSRFRSLLEKPAPAPAEDRLAVQSAAVAQALEAARAEFDATRAADLAAFELRLAEREKELLASIGDTFCGQVVEGLAAIEERVGHHVATALLRFLDHAVRERAVGELREAICALVAGGTAIRLRVSGPAALIKRVEGVIESAGVPVELVESGSADLSVTIDDTIIETNMAAWMNRLMSEAGAANNG
jgi:hypothetical protein